MDLKSCYDGITLVSVPYCKRNIMHYEKEKMFSTLGAPNKRKDERYWQAVELISWYRRMQSIIEECFAELGDAEIISCIANEIAIKVKASACQKVTITFWHSTAHSVRIEISKIFETEMLLKEKLYEEWQEYNENWDGGYMERSEMVLCYEKTQFLQETASKMKELIEEQLPNVKVRVNAY